MATTRENVEALTFTQGLDAGDRPVVIAVGVQFFDETNGRFYPCLDRGYNGVAVVEVDSLKRKIVKSDEMKRSDSNVGKEVVRPRDEREHYLVRGVIDTSVFGDAWVQELHLN